MNQIELEIWEKAPENPQQLVYAGQRKAQEIFAEIKYRLESVGMLPDEYFLIDDQWENGREIPKNAYICCTVQYGESEGIYLDVGIKWYENDETHRGSFATGKTLGESEYHLDRMYLAASEINKALYSSEQRARYMVVGDKDKTPEGAILTLNNAERQLMIDSLIELRNNQPQDITAVEQLLRRVAGSVTEFVNEVGARPLEISNYDMAVLAIQDGNLAAFNEIYAKQPDKLDELLVCAAARPGKIGLIMTSAILNEAKGISNEAYLSACKNAIFTGDTARVLLLAEKAADCVPDLNMSLYGEMISETLSQHKSDIARELVNQCTTEQMQAAHSYTIVQAANYMSGTPLLFDMAEKKFDVTNSAAALIYSLNSKRDGWSLKRLLDNGMELDMRNLSAMQACIRAESSEMGQVLIDRGLNFGAYEKWAAESNNSITNETFTVLKQYWENVNPPEKTEIIMTDEAAFVTELNRIISDFDNESVNNLIKYATEMDASGIMSKGEFYDSFLIEIDTVVQKYGEKSANQVIGICSTVALNPSELRMAAYFLSKGVEPLSIERLAIEGKIDLPDGEQLSIIDVIIKKIKNGDIPENSELPAKDSVKIKRSTKNLADKMQAANEKVKAQNAQNNNKKSRKREERE